MRARQVTFPTIALIAGTRAALGIGLGLLLASRLSPEQRRAAGWALFAVGALSTILGILLNSMFAARRLGTIQYDPRFTNDRFGVFVPAGFDKAASVETLLKGSGAEEVRRG